MINKQTVFLQKFSKLQKIKKMNKLLEISRFRNFQGYVSEMTIKLIKTIYHLRKTVLEKNTLLYPASNSQKDKKLILVIIGSSTKNISVANRLIEKYQKNDEIIICSNDQGSLKAFLEILKGLVQDNLKIKVAKTRYYQSNYQFASFLEGLVREEILINQKFSHAYIIPTSKNHPPFLQIAPLYDSSATMFEEIVKTSRLGEDYCQNFNTSPGKWLNFAISQILILKILEQILAVELLEKNNELISINQNMEIIEDKIKEMINEERREQKKAMLDEALILNG